MRLIKALSVLLLVVFSTGFLFADSGTPAAQATDPGTAAVSSPAPSSTPAAQKPAAPAVTLAAEKVDPQQVAKEEAAQTKAWAPKEKKKVPLVLQPVEFVISSVVDAICFWKKD